MNIDEIQNSIQQHKERSPETYNEIINITIPFYMFHKSMYTQMCKIPENKYQMTNSELDVLASLKISGSNEYILSPTKINERLLFSSAAITKILKKLEEKRYIIRLDDKYDKRSKLVQLTALGEDALNKALKDVTDYEEKVFSILTEEEQESFKQLFLKMLKNS